LANLKIVIVGAGIAGTGLADELTQLGQRDVTVVDQGPIWKTGGATSHAPGLVTRTSTSKMMHRFADYTITKLLSMDVSGQPCFYPVGSIEVALTQERLNYLVRRTEFAASWGFSAEMLSPEECANLNPLLDSSTFIGGFHTTGEGVGKALRGAQAQGERAQSNGAVFIGNTTVTGIATSGSKVTGVQTATGVIPADLVVIAAGGWGNSIAATAGVVLPLVSMEHQYAVTEPLAVLAKGRDGDASVPIVRIYEAGTYVRDEGDKAGIGSFNHRAIPVSDSNMVNNAAKLEDPSKLPFTQVDWDQAWSETLEVMPVLSGVKYEQAYNGVFPYSADGFPLMGPAPSVDGLWVLECLWATHSIGAARSLAQAICGIAPDIDFAPADLTRFDDAELVPADYAQRCDNAYIDTYAIHHPAEPSTSPRGVRMSPFYDEQEKLGAAFFDTSGWERPRWFESNAGLLAGLSAPARDAWSSKFWSPIAGAEHLKTREVAGIFDMTSLRRINVTGRDAAKFLNYAAARNVARGTGAVTYTMLLDHNGGIVSDVTISQLAEDRFFIGGNSPRDVVWLKSISAGYDVQIEDVTNGTTCIAVWGPQAREILAPITDTDLTNDTFKYFNAKETSVAGVAVTAVRVSYVGELGWELACSASGGTQLWNEIMKQANRVGAVPAGRSALTSLRLEKGYRAWGTDMSREDTPTSAGLDFAVRTDGEHLGLAAASARVTTRRLRTLSLTDIETVPTIGQPIFMSGKNAGYITSAEFGWSVGHPVALGWLPAEIKEGESVQIHCGGTTVNAVVAPDAVFDPTGSRIRV
jgi:glycine cleavage system aminomethyltransferase T/glycine/D-amino acid oxidase-like deaminating enzyme